MAQLLLKITPTTITRITVSSDNLTQNLDYDSTLDGFDISDFGLNTTITISAKDYSPELITIEQNITEVELLPVILKECYLRVIQPNGVTRRCKLIVDRTKKSLIIQKYQHKTYYKVDVENYNYNLTNKILVLTNYSGSENDISIPILEEI